MPEITSITYDLNSPGQDYEALIAAIKRIGISFIRPCESYWLVRSYKTPSEIFDLLRPLIDANDRLLVSKFDCGSHKGWLDRDAVNWLNQGC